MTRKRNLHSPLFGFGLLSVLAITISDDDLKLANGLSLSYAEQGANQGIPLILLPGIADSWRIFEPLFAELKDPIENNIYALQIYKTQAAASLVFREAAAWVGMVSVSKKRRYSCRFCNSSSNKF